MGAEIRPADIEGAWQLQSWVIHYPDGREPGYPFGRQPAGLLLYGPDGWMSATVHRSERDSFPTGISPRQLDDTLVAAAYWSFFHYAGTWRIEGDSVIHSVRHSLNPAMAGTEQVRRMALEPPRLTLSGVESIAGGWRSHELVWFRAPTA
jgi:hypothetical protein